MTRGDLLMIKGVVDVRDGVIPYAVDVHVSVLWWPFPGRMRRLMDTLDYLQARGTVLSVREELEAVVMRYAELTMWVDLALIALLSDRGPHCSENLVLTAAARALKPRNEQVLDEAGRKNATGYNVMRRWDHVRKEWGIRHET